MPLDAGRRFLPRMAAQAAISAELARIVGELAEPCPLLQRAPNGL
jgi:hypothetical protein